MTHHILKLAFAIVLAAPALAHAAAPDIDPRIDEAQAIEPDTLPDAFSFPAASGGRAGSLAVSPAIVVSGIEVATPIWVAGGEYRIGNTPWSRAPGMVAEGQRVQLRLPVPAAGAARAIVSIGGVRASFEVQTQQPPRWPARNH